MISCGCQCDLPSWRRDSGVSSECESPPVPSLDESATRALTLAQHPELAPLVDDGAWLRRRTLRGTLDNADVWV